MSPTAFGSTGAVRQALQDFIERTRADELMITAQIYEHEARKRSYEIAAEMRGSIQVKADAPP